MTECIVHDWLGFACTKCGMSLKAWKQTEPGGASRSYVQNHRSPVPEVVTWIDMSKEEYDALRELRESGESIAFTAPEPDGVWPVAPLSGMLDKHQDDVDLDPELAVAAMCIAVGGEIVIREQDIRRAKALGARPSVRMDVKAGVIRVTVEGDDDD